MMNLQGAATGSESQAAALDAPAAPENKSQGAALDNAEAAPEWTNPEWAEPEWNKPQWKILSLLLSYPGDKDFPELLEETAEWASELENPQLIQLVEGFRSVDEDSLKSEYVQYFDLQSKTCLYLTAHELGDSRKRGVALVALRRMLAAAGWEQDETELPDYLPLLFEFLAAKSTEFDAKDVEIRLGRVCKVIAGKLPAESVYYKLFQAAVERLPDVPVPENGIVFTGNETTDLDELPYPVFYE